MRNYSIFSWHCNNSLILRHNLHDLSTWHVTHFPIWNQTISTCKRAAFGANKNHGPKVSWSSSLGKRSNPGESNKPAFVGRISSQFWMAPEYWQQDSVLIAGASMPEASSYKWYVYLPMVCHSVHRPCLSIQAQHIAINANYKAFRYSWACELSPCNTISVQSPKGIWLMTDTPPDPQAPLTMQISTIYSVKSI